MCARACVKWNKWTKIKRNKNQRILDDIMNVFVLIRLQLETKKTQKNKKQPKNIS